MQTAPKLQQMIIQIADKHNVDLDQPSAYLRLTLPGNGQLVLENIGAHRICMTHYIEVNHDFIADPQVVLYTRYRDASDTATEPAFSWAPLEITELFGGWRLYAEVDPEGNLVLYDAVEQAHLAELCDTIIAGHLRRFGWLHLAQRAAEAPIPWTPEEIHARDIRLDEIVSAPGEANHE